MLMSLTSGRKVDKPPDVAVGEDSIGAGFVVGWSELGLRWTLSVHQLLNGPLRPGGQVCDIQSEYPITILLIWAMNKVC